MAEIVFVTPACVRRRDACSSALGLLNHNVHPVVGGDQAIAFPASSAISSWMRAATSRPPAPPVSCGQQHRGLAAAAADFRQRIVRGRARLAHPRFILDDADPPSSMPHQAADGHRVVRNVLSAGPVIIDEDAYVATVGGQQLDLTYTEFELLKYLVAIRAGC